MEAATVIQIFISIFAVFGIYAFFRELCRAVGSRHRYFVAFCASGKDGGEKLYELLYEAAVIAESDVRFAKKTVIFLSDADLLDSESNDVLQKFNVRICANDLKN